MRILNFRSVPLIVLNRKDMFSSLNANCHKALHACNEFHSLNSFIKLFIHLKCMPLLATKYSITIKNRLNKNAINQVLYVSTSVDFFHQLKLDQTSSEVPSNPVTQGLRLHEFVDINKPLMAPRIMPE